LARSPGNWLSSGSNLLMFKYRVNNEFCGVLHRSGADYPVEGPDEDRLPRVLMVPEEV
jgi:hypothetical protein